MPDWRKLLATSTTLAWALLAFCPNVAPGQEEAPSPLAAQIDPADYDLLRVGTDAGGRIVVPTNQVLSPAGRQVAFSGRPTDVALSPDGRWLAVLDRNQVAIVEPESAKAVSRVGHASGSYAGILFAPDGKRVYASNIRGSIGVFRVDDEGKLAAEPPIALPVLKGSSSENPANDEAGPQSPNQEAAPPGASAKNALPTGLALSPDGKTLWAALNLRNSLAQIDTVEGKVVREMRTMELMLGLPPMNQFDASATPMASCFTDSSDRTPYTAVENNIPLDQLNPEVSQISDARRRHWAEVSLALPLDEIDEADEDTLNRILWHAARGSDAGYPAWAVLDEDD